MRLNSKLYNLCNRVLTYLHNEFTNLTSLHLNNGCFFLKHFSTLSVKSTNVYWGFSKLCLVGVIFYWRHQKIKHKIPILEDFIIVRQKIQNFSFFIIKRKRIVYTCSFAHIYSLNQNARQCSRSWRQKNDWKKVSATDKFWTEGETDI